MASCSAFFVYLHMMRAVVNLCVGGGLCKIDRLFKSAQVVPNIQIQILTIKIWNMLLSSAFQFVNLWFRVPPKNFTHFFPQLSFSGFVSRKLIPKMNAFQKSEFLLFSESTFQICSKRFVISSCVLSKHVLSVSELNKYQSWAADEPETITFVILDRIV